ncbi:MAG: hypothetical protein ACJA13_003989 [Paraglaciecola sp.]
MLAAVRVACCVSDPARAGKHFIYSVCEFSLSLLLVFSIFSLARDILFARNCVPSIHSYSLLYRRCLPFSQPVLVVFILVFSAHIEGDKLRLYLTHTLIEAIGFKNFTKYIFRAMNRKTFQFSFLWCHVIFISIFYFSGMKIASPVVTCNGLLVQVDGLDEANAFSSVA